MKGKSIYIILGIFAVLILIYIIQNVSSDKMAVQESAEDISMGIKAEDIAEVHAYRPGHEDSMVVLANGDDGWVVKSMYGAPARKEEAEKMVNEITGLTGELRGRGEELASDFGFTDSTITYLEIIGRGGETLRTLEIGKRGPNYRGCFIRDKGGNKIYLTTDELRQRFGLYSDETLPESKRWVEMDMVSPNRNDLQRVKIYAANKLLEVANEDLPLAVQDDTTGMPPPPQKKWMVVETSPGVTFEEKRINSLLGWVTNFRAVEIADPADADKYGFKNSKYSIEITDLAGDVHTIIIGKPIKGDRTQYYAKYADGETVYIIDESSYDNFFIKPFEKKS